MIWDGKTVLVVWGYKPITTPAIKWHKIGSGNWRGSDRSALEDVYESQITFKGPRTELVDIETALADNRNEFSIICDDAEEIFGADVDYSSSINIVVTSYGRAKQDKFDTWSMPLTLRLLSPTFLSTTPDFTKLRLSSFASTQHSDFDIQKNFTYRNLGYYTDHATDPGVLIGNFTQTKSEMAAIRRYLLTTARASTIVLPAFGGITTPFGSREGVGPFNVKVKNWDDQGRKNLIDWGLQIEFAREFA